MLQDLQFGVRLLVRSPGFTVIAVLTLALGIGASAATYTIIKSMLVLPLPYHEPDRVMLVAGWNLQGNEMNFSVRMVDAADFAAQSQTLQATCYRYWSVNLTGTDVPERVQGYHVSWDTFSMLGVEPLLGRRFEPGDAGPGATPVVILDHGLWMRRFAADRDIIGRTVALNGEPHTVVGVMPTQFKYPQMNFNGDLWAPLRDDMDALRADRARSSWGVMVGRLRDNATVETAQAEVSTFFRTLEEDHPQTNADFGARVIPYQGLLASNMRTGLYAVLAAVGVVLLIVCANVANLLLARGMARRKEIAIRAALGAGCWRITRQLLAESMILSLLGGALGLLLAMWLFDLYRGTLPPIVRITTPALLEVDLDLAALGVTSVLAITAGMLSGLAPALRAGRADLRGSLTVGRADAAGDEPRRLRGLLVVGQVAMSLVLLVCAGLLIRTYTQLAAATPGFNPANVLVMEISLPDAAYAEAEKRAGFYDELLQRMAAIPGVEAAAIVNRAPMSTANTGRIFLIEGRPVPDPSDMPGAYYREVSADYLRAMAIPVVRGRGLGPEDMTGALPVALVNETAAKRHWPGGDPIGRRVRVGGPDSQQPWRVVVGVVGDVHHWSLTQTPSAELYVPYAPAPDSRMNVVARTTGDPLAMAPAVRDSVHRIDPDQPVYGVDSLENMVAQSYGPQSIAVSVMVIFAGVALALAMVGLYGVIAFSVSRRAHEIGVRMALGAQRRHVLRLVLAGGLKLTLVGLAFGLVGAASAARMIRGLLYETSAADPLTFIAVPLLLVLAALLASWIPARRALRVSPLSALQYE